MSNLKFSILIPTYKGADVIGETLRSILSQDFSDFEAIVHEDCSGDNIMQVLTDLNDPRIKYYENEHNLGYPGNLEQARKKATGDIIYLMGQDDILAEHALRNTYDAFKDNDDVGAVTRPYYWFDDAIDRPVRAKKQLNKEKNEIVSITDPIDRIITMFSTLDQLSGLAYRVKCVDVPFHQDIFPCHVYPFASIFKKHRVMFLRDYSVAVRIATSQTRHISSIYNKSPIQSWVELFENIFYEEEYRCFRNRMITEFVSTNYVGLVQLRNYAKYSQLVREIYMLLKYRKHNILAPGFWFFSLGTLVVPPIILIPLVDKYKKLVYSSFLDDINFSYKI